MDGYARYLRQKALLDFYSGLSEEDRSMFVRQFCAEKNVTAQLDRIEQAVTKRGGFIKGVGENVVGNAVYDVALAIGKTVIKKILP